MTESLLERRTREVEEVRERAHLTGWTRVALARRDRYGNPDPHDTPVDLLEWPEPGGLVHEMVRSLNAPAVRLRLPWKPGAADAAADRVIATGQRVLGWLDRVSGLE
jgi:hypothetical protein